MNGRITAVSLVISAVIKKNITITKSLIFFFFNVIECKIIAEIISNPQIISTFPAVQQILLRLLGYKRSKSAVTKVYFVFPRYFENKMHEAITKA